MIMTRKRAALRPVVCYWIALVYLTGCGPRARDERTAYFRPHGVTVGSHLESTTLACANQTRTEFAPTDEAQLVTFESAGDCAECLMHLRGLARMRESADAWPDHIAVAYSPLGERSRDTQILLGRSSLRLCFDEGSRIWRRWSIQNTPFTLLLIDGIAVYGNDRTLDTEGDRQEFLRSIASLIRRPRSRTR